MEVAVVGETRGIDRAMANPQGRRNLDSLLTTLRGLRQLSGLWVAVPGTGGLWPLYPIIVQVFG